jgi:hypothetical protein
MVQIFAAFILLLTSPQQPGEKPSNNPSKTEITPKTTSDSTPTTTPTPTVTKDSTPVEATKEIELPKEKVISTRVVPVKQQVIIDKPPEKKKFSIGTEIFFAYGYTKSDSGNFAGNEWDIGRAQLNLGFFPSEKVGAYIVLDKTRDLTGEYEMYLKYGWLEFSNLFEEMGKLKLITGQYPNGWKKAREKAINIRYIVKTPLEKYGFIPSGDLGMWIQGPILGDMLDIWTGVGNGSGNKSQEFDKGKVADIMAIYHLKAPIPMDFTIYLRNQLNDNLTNPDEKTYSFTTAFALDAKYDIFKFGIEYFYHTYNDWDLMDPTVKIRRNFHSASAYTTVTPIKKVLGFLRADVLGYKYGVSYSADPVASTRFTLLAGVGYNLFKSFWIGASFTMHKVDVTDPINKKSYKSGSSYDAPATSDYWVVERDGEKIFQIHTKFKF